MKEAPIQRLKSDMGRFKPTPRPVVVRDDWRRLVTRQIYLRIETVMLSKFVRIPLFWVSTLVGIVWAAPLTALGLLLALPVVLFSGHAQLVRGHTLALLVRGRAADFMLNHHPFGAMNAMALGHVVIAAHDGLSSRVLVHELAHVRQAARWGIVFPFAYLASSAWAAIRGRDAYWHNRFEIAARRAEKHI